MLSEMWIGHPLSRDSFIGLWGSCIGLIWLVWWGYSGVGGGLKTDLHCGEVGAFFIGRSLPAADVQGGCQLAPLVSRQKGRGV